MVDVNDETEARVSLFGRIRQLVFKKEEKSSTLMFCSLIITGLFLGMTNKARYLVLSPEALIDYHYLWTIFTTWFVETNPIIGIFHVCYIFACGVFLEPIISKIFQFYTLMVASCSVSAVVLTKVLSYYGSYADAHFVNPVIGAAGVAAGHGVMISYLVPDKKIFHGFGIPCRFIPFFAVVVSASLIASKVGVRSNHLSLTLWGIYFGWFYIRFYKLDPVTGIKGDTEFTLDLFFPRPLRPIVRMLTSIVLGVLNFIGLFREKQSTIQLQNAFNARVKEDEPLLMEQVDKDPEAQIDERLRAYQK